MIPKIYSSEDGHLDYPLSLPKGYDGIVRYYVEEYGHNFLLSYQYWAINRHGDFTYYGIFYVNREGHSSNAFYASDNEKFSFGWGYRADVERHVKERVEKSLLKILYL